MSSVLVIPETFGAASELMADDGRAEARRNRRGDLCPFHRVGGDDDARSAHAEGFGERVIDGDAVDRHTHAARALPG